MLDVFQDYFTLLQAVVAYVLALLVMQSDPVVGTQAFWLTRPIGRLPLLASKLVAIAFVLGVLPLAVLLPWWWRCGFSAGDMSLAVVEWWAMGAVLTVPAALVAVLTDSVSRALLWSLVLLTVFIVVGASFGSSTSFLQRSGPLLLSRQILGAGVVGLVFSAVIVTQFLVRRRGLWLAGAAVVLLIGLVVVSRWPRTFLATEPEVFRPERGATVQARLETAVSDPLPPARPGELDVLRRQLIETRFLIEGVPAGVWLTGLGAKQVWRFGDQFSTEWSEHLVGSGEHDLRLDGLKLFDPWSDPETHRALEARRENLNGVSVPMPKGDRAWLATSAQLRPSVVARMRTEPPAYAATLWLELLRATLHFEMPVAPSAWKTGSGWGVRIVAVDSLKPTNSDAQLAGRTVRLLETTPSPWIEMVRARMARGLWFRAPVAERKQGFVLLHRGAGQFHALVGVERGPPDLLINGVRLRTVQLSARIPGVMRDGVGVPAPGWDERYTLGRASFETEAIVVREVQTPSFQVAEK
ncbi:hypothetical protein [Horticoccus sp. 23ND18S-11]|uniref:hypothetical protein n=1 Tax=Horticoccus sp. 23ND18S-11 TaxID=3391832 RepID=UPI0039C9199E